MEGIIAVVDGRICGGSVVDVCEEGGEVDIDVEGESDPCEEMDGVFDRYRVTLHTNGDRRPIREFGGLQLLASLLAYQPTEFVEDDSLDVDRLVSSSPVVVDDSLSSVDYEAGGVCSDSVVRSNRVASTMAEIDGQDDDDDDDEDDDDDDEEASGVSTLCAKLLSDNVQASTDTAVSESDLSSTFSVVKLTKNGDEVLVVGRQLFSYRPGRCI